MENNMNIPSRYWEAGIEESWESKEEIQEAEKWIEENGIPYDAELPFN